MEQHSQHHTSNIDSVSVSDAFNPRMELAPELVVLHDIANKYYKPMIKIAEKSDDEQPAFTSEGVQYVKASALTAKMALRAAQMAAQKSA